MLEPLSQQEFDAFVAFGRQQLASASPVGSLQDLCDRWHRTESAGGLSGSDVEAVNRAIQDLQDGDRGRKASEHLNRVRERIQAGGE